MCQVDAVPATPTKSSSSSRFAHGKTLRVSPYFSPKRRRTCRTSEHLGANLNLTCDIDSSPTEKDPTEVSQRANGLENNDPLTSFYFRSFARLFARLEVAKPVLIQEIVSDDPWKVLVAVTLLNKTSGKLAIPVFWQIMAQYPSAHNLSQAPQAFLQVLLQPLGLHVIRSKRLIALSEAYINDPPSLACPRKSNSYFLSPCPPDDASSEPPSAELGMPELKRIRYPPTPISHLPGTGSYALDSYRIFCTPHEWKEVFPSDKELIRYLKWKWAFEERKMWSPYSGVTGNVDIEYLKALLKLLKQTDRLSEDC